MQCPYLVVIRGGPFSSRLTNLPGPRRRLIGHLSPFLQPDNLEEFIKQRTDPRYSPPPWCTLRYISIVSHFPVPSELSENIAKQI